MEFLSEFSAPTVAMASALTAAAGAYLNAKFSISTDLTAIHHDRSWKSRLEQRIGQLGDTPTIYWMLERTIEVDGNGAAQAIWFENKTWTYAQLKDLVDRFAALLHSRGIKKGDFVGVFTINSPEMVVAIYALAKLGAVASLLNTNLRDDTFIHCLNVSRSTFMISTPDLSQDVRSDLPHIALNLSSFDGVSTGTIETVTAADLQRYAPTDVTAATGSPADLTVLIYTSGTTGKPKACAIRNFMALVTSTPLTSDVSDPAKYFPLRIYSPLPLFHGTAYFTGLCYSVGTGGTLCLRRKFSASQFWKDVHDSQATRILYIGELCRYLLATPPSPFDKDHSCIVAAGNGLREEIWERFRQRFGVPEIREFYRSTEGITKFDNFGVGAWGAGKIGFSGPIKRYLEDDMFIVKYDTETEMPYRSPATGFCVQAQPGEEGEAIGRVRSRALLTEYLHDENSTEKKLLRDVFQKGDIFQRTGDLMVRDESGWLKFQDRVGDTFRWKGENVSAGEVRDHICRIASVHDAVVYGVKLGGYDGQAGAAGITLDNPSAEDEFMPNLYRRLKKKGVPPYAFPRLVRLTEKVATGVTFKQAKGDLAKKGWNPQGDWNGDKLYWLNGKSYEPLDSRSWALIENGKAKL
ncbi:putative bifunctional fatty acid transporter/acyl-CoA synthetase (FAT1) [Aspergillus candidus]|uniref:Acyl-CoA synthetases /AMP-acid ligases II n=1 Tax=Aspergillus candidus TaxID=41067 RepID=A0A2I2F0M6_ASPCN|nr:acyl-CoA synthetases /AMP-acid ligases II [Aspergillus candidus]PLB34192.1 acyl-CoA synthetases /AMP-acid ligases II [Aspergillus candidus]